jgi:hypothetical protein
MKQSDYSRLEDMLVRAYKLAAQVVNGNKVDTTLAEEVCGECAELLTLMDNDMGAFGGEEVIDKELQSLALMLQKESK